MRSADPELYKDKIEISLDGRQVFYLFFGGAVIACLVFVLGVMVGRRVEARAHVDRGAATSAARDPLTALDKLDASSREDMSFQTSLAGGKPAASEVDQAVAAIEKARADAARKEEGGKGKKAARAEPPPELEVEPAVVVKPEPKPDAKSDAKKDAKAAKLEARAAAPASKPEDSGRFTLQLSSFKEKSEAEAFQVNIRDAGYRAYLVEAEVEGKGRFFRVRFGSYDSYQAALAAKDEFERKVQKIAYVTRL